MDKQTYQYTMKLKSIVIMAMLLPFVIAAQQTNFKLSGDTLTCSNNASRFKMKNMSVNLPLNQNLKAITHVDDDQVLIYLEKMNYEFAPALESNSFYRLTFPTLSTSCDLKKARSFEDVLHSICDHELLNAYGLDTNKVLVYAVVKGKVSDSELKGVKSRLDSISEDRSVIMYRNLNAYVQIEVEDIVQDKIKIGSYESDTLLGLKGSQVQYKIYNSIGAMICSATETKMGSKDWRLLTFRDNKFHSLPVKGNEDLRELILYLIRNSYL